VKTQGTDNNAATAKATRDSSSRGEVTTDPAAKTLIEAKTFTRAATTTATAAPVDGTMVRAETPISTSRAGVLRREYRLLCAAATRHETDWKSLLSPLLHSTSIAAGTQRGYANREYGNRDDRRRQQQQHRRRRPGDDEGRPHTTDRQARVFKPDWMCPRGCGVVFGSKSNCFKCGSPREAGADEVPADVVYGGVVAGKFDWVCNVLGCTSVNFARRSVCFTCLVPKGPLATKVDQSDRPGGGGKGGGDLLANRFDPARARQASDAAAAAAWGVAAAAGQQPVDATANAAWAPKEFNESADAAMAPPGRDQQYAVEPAADPTAAQQHAQQQHAQQPGSIAKDPAAASKKKRRKEPALPGAIEDAAGGAAAVAALEQSGYVYDPDTGYYKDEASGMWYDANSGLSYHAESAAWYKWNAETNSYEPAAGHAPAAAAAGAGAGAAAQQPQQSAAKKPRVAATIGSTAKLDMVAIKKHQVAKVAAAELETMESAYRDRAAERRSSAAAAAAAAATGSVKGKVYGGKIRTPGVPGYAPGSVPPSTSGGAGEGEDSYKASVQRVALERFKAAMKE